MTSASAEKVQKSLSSSWRIRALLVMVLDAACIAGSYLLALLMRFDFLWSHVEAQYLERYRGLALPLVVVLIACLWVARLYQSIWRYASVPELLRLVAVWAGATAVFTLWSLFGGVRMPLSFWLGGGMIGLFLTAGTRFSYRLLRALRNRRNASEAKHVMLIGGGEAGRALIRELRTSNKLDLEVVCIIDDNPGKAGRYLEGVPIVGGRSMIAQAAAKYEVDQIIFAIPSLVGSERRKILELCQATGCEVRAVPGMFQLVDGQVSVTSLREVNLEDLLGRDPIVVDAAEVRSSIEGKVVLVTGGGGSIGSELCRQVARDNPARLIIFDVYENNAYAIQQELRHTHPELDLVTLIGSVRNEARLQSVFASYHPQVVFHAAAHKHVPLMEDSPNEAIKNNVMGTLKCAQAALDHGCERFVLISTDKAVNPTNVMGASKRLCEMVVQMMNRRAAAEGRPTSYVAVRFGNVLGSNGSVVPLFERQISEGGPVTVTDPRITRYFMTIPEAVSLVLQAACYAQGGEIFVLDMGDPVKIDDMARNLIRLSGYEPDVDIQVVYTGLRPGEKLYEERLMDEEGLRRTANKLISIAEPIEMDDAAFALQLTRLDEASRSESDDIRPLIAEVVPTYHPEQGGAAA